MSGWSAIFGSIFLNNNKQTRGLSISVTKTEHFESLCGEYRVDFKERDVAYLKLIANVDNTITHQGITFKHINTSIK